MSQDAFVKDYLEHFGKKGMRWGIRNRKGSRTTNVSTQRAKQHPNLKTSADFKKSRQLKNKGVHALTNKQLRDVNDRLNLEQNFHRMNPKAIKKGEARLKAALGTATLLTSVVGLASSPGGKALIGIGKGAVGKGAAKRHRETRALLALSKTAKF